MKTELFSEAIVAAESKLQRKPVTSLSEDVAEDLWLVGFIQPFLPYDERSVSWDGIRFVEGCLNMRPQVPVGILKLAFEGFGKLGEAVMSVR